jgi:chromosome segregation ATPase
VEDLFKSEVITIMMSLFDDEEIMKSYIRSERYDATCETARKLIAFKDERIKSLEASNAEKDNQLAEKDNNISELRAENNELAAKNAALMAELAQAKAMVGTVKKE